MSASVNYLLVIALRSRNRRACWPSPKQVHPARPCQKVWKSPYSDLIITVTNHSALWSELNFILIEKILEPS